MTYEGTFARLRAMEPGDAAAQHRWFNDPEVTGYLDVRYPVSATAVAGRLEGAGTMTFANPRFSVDRLDTGDVVGYVALRDVTPESRNAELEVFLGDRTVWATVGRDAVRLAVGFAFDRIGLHRVHTWVLAEDDAARAAFGNAEFVVEGTARDRVYRRGRWHDCVLLGLLRSEAV